jgi:small subunit ribosomal protein S8
VGIAEVLKTEGFITGYEVSQGESFSTLTVELKYGPDGEEVIRSIDRVSKPGCRTYTSVKTMPHALRGLGIFVLSTPRGILSDRAARKENVGGEILCKVC